VTTAGPARTSICVGAGLPGITATQSHPLSSRMRVGPGRPNPFSSALRVPVEVPVAAGGRVRAYVLDASGRLVARVYDGVAPNGRLSVSWSGSDSRGREVASGVYWFVAESGGERHAVRLVRIR